MNLRIIFNTIGRFFLLTNSFDNLNLQNIINNVTVYANGYDKLSYNERIMVYHVINMIN
jgi:hypothetical protein